MMDHLTALAALAVMHFVAAATPGPNIVAVSYLSASHSRRHGLRAAAGVVSGSILWMVLSLAGVGALLIEAGWLYRALRIAGAAYLLYVGAKLLLAAWRAPARTGDLAPAYVRAARAPFLTGFLTTISNPKSAVFWTSLFIVAVPPDAQAGFYAALIAIVTLQSAGWYALVALALSTGPARRAYRGAARWLDGLAGTAMTALGLKLANDVRRELTP